jgi:hypothetical protein
MSQKNQRCWRGPGAGTVSALALALAASTSGTALAQALPVEIEGPITAIECLDENVSPPDCDTGVPAGVAMTVMDIRVEVPEGTPIASPSRSLNSRLLSAPRRFPGRSERGFIGGTGIIIGQTDGISPVVADDVFVEPAENVIVGVVTENIPPVG